MIRAHNALRPDAACHSADVLTGPERAADAAKPRMEARAPAAATRTPGMRWGDVPEIRSILATWRQGHADATD